MPNSLQIKLTDYATETKQDIIDTVVDAIKTKTDALPTDPADQSLLKAEIDANETKIDTVDGVVDAIKAKTDALPASPAPAGEYDTEMARITANVATEAKQDIIDTVVDAIKTKTDALPTDPADESLLEAHVTAEVDDLITRAKGLDDIHDDIPALGKAGPNDILPVGQPSIATGVVSGSGWIIGAFASHAPRYAAEGYTYRTVSLSVDGGGAVVILRLDGREYGTDHWGAGGAGVGLLIRYTTGFTPSSAASGEETGSFGVIYIAD